MIPAVGTHHLASVRGVLQWVVFPIGLAIGDCLRLALDRDHRVAGAIDLYLSLRAEEPSRWNFDVDQLKTVGRLLLENDRAEEAVEVLALNADMFSDWGPAHTALGNALLSAGDAEGALGSFEHALLLDPDDAVARAGLAAVAEAR